MNIFFELKLKEDIEFLKNKIEMQKKIKN